ncbi:MAG: ABC transporter ATP-binding protein [Ruminococcaceae bacterium]|nr:ABC transporter ATP-binding protein [Oscillospiraceae bacterium]
MSRTVIEVNNVSMRFHMNADKILSLKEFVTRKLRGKIQYEDFTALDHVSFSVQSGETLGLIGHNGAGKSTMLKVISGILKPTEGSVTTRGSVVPMLELGSGFDMDLTGRENIFLNGAILGYSEEFLQERYDEIVAFAELGQFIDVPIRNYSSGMMARLAFSVASLVEPEILIVDEILSVGDAPFQEKSRARMKDLMGGGTTVLFVSHSLDQIREMCKRVVWLEHGQVKMVGKTEEVCDAYNSFQGVPC